jgi:hypothetical protein
MGLSNLIGLQVVNARAFSGRSEIIDDDKNRNFAPSNTPHRDYLPFRTFITPFTVDCRGSSAAFPMLHSREASLFRAN